MASVGAEFYMREWPQLVGATFADVLVRFEAAVPLGVRRSSDSALMINPLDSYRIQPGVPPRARSPALPSHLSLCP